MRFTRWAFILAIPAMLFALAGCGSDSSGGAFNPTSLGTGGSTGGTGGGGGTGGTTGTATMVLVTDRTSVDVNIGQVLATATVTDANGAAISGRPVAFSVVAGPATVDAASVTTDANGIAQKIVIPGNSSTTTNIIIHATTIVGTQTVTAYASFQLVRGSGVIMFTDAAGQTPGTQTNLLTPASKTVDPTIASAWTFEQLIPFKVTDSNGNPRVGVPVTLSVYSIIGDPTSVIIDFLVPPITEPNQQTITTDSAGQGIFNVSVTLTTPPPRGVNTESIVFKAVTDDTIPVTAYVGNTYELTSTLPTLTIAPSAASFGTATDITFAVTGGVPPYNVSSNNTGRVTATLQADGHTVIAHLVDTTAWTGSVTISATDSAGQSASATVTR